MTKYLAGNSFKLKQHTRESMFEMARDAEIKLFSASLSTMLKLM